MHIFNNERLTAFVLTLAVILLILLEKSTLLSIVSATAAVTTTIATTSTTKPPTATHIKHLVVIYQDVTWSFQSVTCWKYFVPIHNHYFSWLGSDID
jgi:hypothetical protein